LVPIVSIKFHIPYTILEVALHIIYWRVIILVTRDI
jgi:hypothetical protein